MLSSKLRYNTLPTYIKYLLSLLNLRSSLKFCENFRPNSAKKRKDLENYGLPCTLVISSNVCIGADYVEAEGHIAPQK